MQFKPSRCIVKKSNRSLTKCSSTPKKRPLPKEDLLPTGSLYGTRRKSARLDGKVIYNVHANILFLK